MTWSTKLPNRLKSGSRYLVTLKTSYGNMVRQAEFREIHEGCFRWFLLPNGPFEYPNVIAWMKEPKPYEGK